MAGHSPVYICCNDIYIDKNSIKAYFRTRDVLPVVLKEKQSYQVIPAGIIYAIAALSYIISVQMNGVNLAFVMSQLCVVISTLGGIVFLHEQKTKKGYIYTVIGLALIVAGAVLTSVF